jgi:hypothetical protein
MTDRFNTIAGWTLFAGIVALGLSIASGLYFEADKPHRPHAMGFPIEGVVEEGAADEGPALATLLATRRRAGRFSPSAWRATRSNRAAPTGSARTSTASSASRSASTPRALLIRPISPGLAGNGPTSSWTSG